jgi:hypothetical protein
MRWSRCAVGLWCVVEWSGNPLWARDGFGFVHGKEASITVVRPPRVALGTRLLEIRVTASQPSDAALTQRLSGEVESELGHRGCPLTTNPSLAGAVLELKILARSRSDRWQRPSGVAAALAQLSGSGLSSALPSQEDVRETLRVAYRVVAGEVSLDADTLEVATASSVRQGDSPPTAAETESKVIEALVAGIASRVTASRERVTVLVPRGGLDRFARLAESGQWSLYRAALETVRGADVRSESYRQYGLGLAHEAVAYAQSTPDGIRIALEHAESFYVTALASNPDESYFVRGPTAPSAASAPSARSEGESPLRRVRASLAAYRQVAPGVANSRLDPPKLPPPSAAPAMTNRIIVSMSQAGVPAEVILRAIDAAASTDFDVAPSALVALVAAKVDRSVIVRMQDLARRGAAASSPARPAVP